MYPTETVRKSYTAAVTCCVTLAQLRCVQYEISGVFLISQLLILVKIKLIIQVLPATISFRFNRMKTSTVYC